MSKKYKVIRDSRGENPRYFIDCELFNLKYEDKIAVKEYTKEAQSWDELRAKKRRVAKKARMTRRKNRRLKREKEATTPDSTPHSSPESNKNTMT